MCTWVFYKQLATLHPISTMEIRESFPFDFIIALQSFWNSKLFVSYGCIVS